MITLASVFEGRQKQGNLEPRARVVQRFRINPKSLGLYKAQDILAHRLQISATISRLKVLCLRVWTSYHQSFVWSKVFPLDQWKSKKFAEREEFSDDVESDKEDESPKEDEVGEFEVPLKKIEAQKAPQKRLRIPKKRIREKSAVPRKRKQKQPPPPTKRRRKLETKPSRISSKKF